MDKDNQRRPNEWVEQSPTDSRLKPQRQEVVIVDFQMPFGSIVYLMIKCALAAIPAILILFVLSAVFSGMLGAMFGFGHH